MFYGDTLYLQLWCSVSELLRLWQWGSWKCFQENILELIWVTFTWVSWIVWSRSKRRWGWWLLQVGILLMWRLLWTGVIAGESSLNMMMIWTVEMGEMRMMRIWWGEAGAREQWFVWEWSCSSSDSSSWPGSRWQQCEVWPWAGGGEQWWGWWTVSDTPEQAWNTEVETPANIHFSHLVSLISRLWNSV